MAFGVIGVGAVANDGAGDTLRVAMQTINTNFGLAAPLASPTFTGTVDASGLFKGKGTATNDDAAAAYIQEYAETILASGSAVALTTGVPKTVAGVTLTAGDWEVSAVLALTGAATTTLGIAIGSISSTTNVLGTDGLGGYTQNWYNNVAFFSSSSLCLPVGPIRKSLSGSLGIFIVAQASFGVSTCSAYGHIRARRVR